MAETAASQSEVAEPTADGEMLDLDLGSLDDEDLELDSDADPLADLSTDDNGLDLDLDADPLLDLSTDDNGLDLPHASAA